MGTRFFAYTYKKLSFGTKKERKRMLCVLVSNCALIKCFYLHILQHKMLCVTIVSSYHCFYIFYVSVIFGIIIATIGVIIQRWKLAPDEPDWLEELRYKGVHKCYLEASNIKICKVGICEQRSQHWLLWTIAGIYEDKQFVPQSNQSLKSC